MLTNTCVLWRIWQTEKEIPVGGWPGVDKFRAKCNRKISHPNFAQEVARVLLETTSHNGTSAVRSSGDEATVDADADAVDQATVAEGRAMMAKRNRKAFGNDASVKRVRLSKNMQHDQVHTGKTTCVVCKGRTAKACSLCGVPLHTQRLKSNLGQRTTCWHKWHNTTRLETSRAYADCVTESASV